MPSFLASSRQFCHNHKALLNSNLQNFVLVESLDILFAMGALLVMIGVVIKERG